MTERLILEILKENNISVEEKDGVYIANDGHRENKLFDMLKYYGLDDYNSYSITEATDCIYRVYDIIADAVSEDTILDKIERQELQRLFTAINDLENISDQLRN